MTSIFDPNALLDATLSEPSTKRPLLPIGDYTAIVKEVTAATWASKDGAKNGMKFNVPLSLQIPYDVKESLKLEDDTVTLADSIMLDLTPQGAIDNSPGKNSRLRQYREALDMNKPGDAFNARKMTGQLLLVRLEHREYNGDILENVTKVAKAV